MKLYYGANDICKIIGIGPNKAYQIIRELRNMFEKEYPEAIPIQGRIPIWYFNQKMGLSSLEENVEVK